jgi:DNA-binding NtrC family response regulator
MASKKQGERKGRNRTMAPRILLLEDDSGSREALVEALSRRHYKVDAARTVEEFQAFLDGTEASLALLDRHVGGRDSLLLLEDIRRFSPDLPVLVMSSDASPDVVREVLSRGVRAFLAKPFNLGTLVTTIEEILG